MTIENSAKEVLSTVSRKEAAGAWLTDFKAETSGGQILRITAQRKSYGIFGTNRGWPLHHPTDFPTFLFGNDRRVRAEQKGLAGLNRLPE